MHGIDVWFELGALLPSIGVGLLGWFILRAILRADSQQRRAEREAEAEYLAAHPEVAKRLAAKD